MSALPSLTYQLLRPVLFRLDPESAHWRALSSLDWVERLNLARALFPARVEDPTNLLGLTFPNRVGIAAGLDKNAAHAAGLCALGPGFLEIGTVTPLPQPGNPRPRLFRDPALKAIINRFGFNSDGLQVVLERMHALRRKGKAAGMSLPVLGMNIGKNAATPMADAARDYVQGLQAVASVADYVAVNVSSPNTANLRSLQGGDALDDLLAALDRARADLQRAGSGLPVLLKIAPDLEDAHIEAIAQALVRYSFDGVIATNTTLSRPPSLAADLAQQAGGLSGAPLRERADYVVRALRAALPAGFPVIGVGGIGSPADAIARHAAGANLVQVYSGLIYSGPGLVRDCAAALAGVADRPNR